MDRAAIQNLFEFTGFAWRLYVDVIARAGGVEVLTRPVLGSGWPALRDCLGHIVLAYQRWCSGFPERKALGMDRFDPGAIATLEELEGYRSEARAEFQTILDSLTDADLVKVQDFDIDGNTIGYSYAELMTHLLLHERGHHGDLNTLLYQLGIDIPMVEYRFHLRRFDHD